MANGEKPPEPQWLFYILSFIVPVAGLVIGVIYLTKQDEVCRTFGRNCVIAAVAAIITCCICYVLYFVGVFSLAGLGSVFAQ